MPLLFTGLCISLHGSFGTSGSCIKRVPSQNSVKSVPKYWKFSCNFAEQKESKIFQYKGQIYCKENLCKPDALDILENTKKEVIYHGVMTNNHSVAMFKFSIFGPIFPNAIKLISQYSIFSAESTLHEDTTNIFQIFFLYSCEKCIVMVSPRTDLFMNTLYFVCIFCPIIFLGIYSIVILLKCNTYFVWVCSCTESWLSIFLIFHYELYFE